MNVSTVPTINGDQTPSYNRAHHIVISNQPHLQQQQLIQQHLQQKHHLQHQQHLIHNIKEDGNSSSRKSSASSFFAAIRPRSKSDSARRRSDKIQNQISTISDRVTILCLYLKEWQLIRLKFLLLVLLWFGSIFIFLC